MKTVLRTPRWWRGGLQLLLNGAIVPVLAAGVAPCPTKAAERLAGQEMAMPTQMYEVEVSRDLVYHRVKDDPDVERHRLDVYRPKGQTGRPVLFFVHGGGWMIGKKDDYFGILGYGTVARCLARRGLVVVVPNYRLSPGVRHPEHIKDVARAFAWTCCNAARFGGNARHIVVCGHSAGGHLVSLLATDETYLRAVGRSRRDVRGVIGICGVYCVEDLEVQLSAAAPGDWLRLQTKVSPFSIVFGTDPAFLKKASPITHVGPGLPPFLLLDAGLNYWPLRKMTKDFAAALAENCIDVEVRDSPWHTHETLVFDILHQTAEAATVEAIVEFVGQTKPTMGR
jgi:acetyl esterase/lipase